MSAFDGYAFSPGEFSGTARLFPVPGLVMFPHVMQPLHVFEPRYCDLLGDAARDDRLIAMPTLAPGWERDYEGRPALGAVACLGRIVASKPLGNGTHNLLLVGMRRVRLLREVPSTRSYREAEVEVCEDVYPAGQEVYQRVLTRELHRAMGQVLPGLPQAREQLDQLLRGEVSLGVLTDVIAYALDLSLAQKESLLAETNVHRRGELLLECLMVVDHRCAAAAPAMAIFPPSFSAN
jgi:ATP-dependent Lon protease